MAAVRGRYKRTRHILGEPLSEVEVQTLQEMSKHHRYADFRRRALGVLALNEGRSVEDISGVLRVTVPPVYEWARAWRERGLMGMLSGHVGGPPRKLTPELLDVTIAFVPASDRRHVHFLCPSALLPQATDWQITAKMFLVAPGYLRMITWHAATPGSIQ